MFLLYSVFIFSQKMRTDNYELYLLSIEENVVKISKGMYMTDKDQYYYEGSIDVTCTNTGEEKKYTFFFSTWDNKYKEFLIKDSNRNIVNPKISFKDKTTAYLNNSKNVKLKNNSSIYNSILSSMIIWLDNQ